jgi:hypothetical protein
MQIKNRDVKHYVSTFFYICMSQFLVLCLKYHLSIKLL